MKFLFEWVYILIQFFFSPKYPCSSFTSAATMSLLDWPDVRFNLEKREDIKEKEDGLIDSYFVVPPVEISGFY